MIYSAHVTPNAKLNKVEIFEDIIRIHTTAKAVDGSANSATVKLLSKHFNIPKNKIIILRGEKSRSKIIEINS